MWCWLRHRWRHACRRLPCVAWHTVGSCRVLRQPQSLEPTAEILLARMIVVNCSCFELTTESKLLRFVIFHCHVFMPDCRHAVYKMRPIATDFARLCVCVCMCVCVCVCVLVTHTCPAKENGGTDRGDVWVTNSHGPQEPCISVRRSTTGRSSFRGCPDHWKALGVSAAVYAAKESFNPQKWHDLMRLFIEILWSLVVYAEYWQTALLTINVIKLQFIHTVNGDGSKTAKNHKKAMLTTLTLTIRLC